MNLRSKTISSFIASRHAPMAALVLAMLLLVALPQAHADSITVNSSSAVTYLEGPQATDFSSPFTAANFAAAQTGPAASVLTSTPFYTGSLPNGPGAVWIGTNSTAGAVSGNTALYAISFNVAGPVSSASLNFYYGVDNILGESNAGLYINGTALPNSTGLVCSLCTSSFEQQNLYSDANIGSLLVTGTNWLYVDAVNQGGPAGLIFSADINAAPATATPEPSSLFLLGAGVLSLLGFVVRGKRQPLPATC